ncbi:CBO2463/CBO2479 domain-containing protein [Listeria ilorinensis]|uniref:CBO2463/CBO2479 domain-containing protein n=1 Tax=Listeria ilorinensis TaxID=2867439 RepID=UPI001EF5F0D8|nr:CBO2463/CBO2479 domain-containing protein [Listeria ilorinensis]
MNREDLLKYQSTERMFEGILVEITDASVTIDIKGRLGTFKIPRRMLISQYDLALGQEVGFMMSYPEVLAEKPDDKYVEAIEETKKRRDEIRTRMSEKGAE